MVISDCEIAELALQFVYVCPRFYTVLYVGDFLGSYVHLLKMASFS